MRTSAAGDRAGAPARPRSTAIGARLARERRTTGVVVCLGVVLVALLGLADARVEDLAHQLNVSSYAVVAGVDIVFAIAGAIVAYHQPRNAVGWLFLGVALFLALSGLAGDYSTLVYRVHRGSTTLGPIAVLAQPSWAPAIVCIALSILLFPDGHLPPGRWRWGLWAFLALAALWLGGAYATATNAIVEHTIRVNPGGDLAIIDTPTGGAAWWGYVQDVFFPALVVCALAWLGRQLVSFRRSSGERRQQLKWLISGVAISVLSGTAGAIGLSSSWLGQIANVITSVGIAAFPVSVGVGILRYRLYEIDRLISRTLSYAILTAALVGTFVGLVALTTDTLALSGRVGVAASTLAAAALLHPLRIRIQRLVDRRFNRARYDAEATVAAFTATLRDAVELDAIRAELLAAVQRAVAPSSASLWIR